MKRWRYAAFPTALVAGLALAVAVGASQSPCPSGYNATKHGKVVLCLRTVTHTITATRLVASPPLTVTNATTILEPGATTTVTVPTTQTLTTTVPGTTSTQTVTTTTTATQTTTVQAPPVTTTVTVTAPATVSLEWCGGYGGNWNDGNCDAPPSPLSVPAGSRVELAAVAQGSFGSDPYPAGCLDFTVAPHPVSASWTEYDQAYGLNPDASHDCSCVENFSGQASGACLYSFGTRGAYTIGVAANLADRAYGSATASPITTAVQVG